MWPSGGATSFLRPGSPRTRGRRSYTAGGSCSGCAWKQISSLSPTQGETGVGRDRDRDRGKPGPEPLRGTLVQPCLSRTGGSLPPGLAIGEKALAWRSGSRPHGNDSVRIIAGLALRSCLGTAAALKPPQAHRRAAGSPARACAALRRLAGRGGEAQELAQAAAVRLARASICHGICRSGRHSLGRHFACSIRNNAGFNAQALPWKPELQVCAGDACIRDPQTGAGCAQNTIPMKSHEGKQGGKRADESGHQSREPVEGAVDSSPCRRYSPTPALVRGKAFGNQHADQSQRA